MDTTLNGIHHITAIASDPQRNVDFYAGVLGLRLVKKTINFDDPETYHLYYGDGVGSPGTLITFFPWPGAPRGRQGAGSLSGAAFAIPDGAVGFWIERLRQHDIAARGPTTRFGQEVLSLHDPDGMPLELIAQPLAALTQQPWERGPVPTEQAIRGFAPPTMTIPRPEATIALLSQVMGFQQIAAAGDRVRFALIPGEPSAAVDVLIAPAAARGVQAAGTVHHIAWRATDDAAQLAWRETLRRSGLYVTPVQERQYFRSIYYREPGGVLFEIATDPPGMTIDEPVTALGEALMLPPWFEARRSALEQALPALHLPTAEHVR